VRDIRAFWTNGRGDAIRVCRIYVLASVRELAIGLLSVAILSSCDTPPSKLPLPSSCDGTVRCSCTFRVMIRRSPMGDAQPPQRFQEARRSELRPVVRGQRQVLLADCLRAVVRARPAPPLGARLRSDSDAKDSTPRSPVYNSRSRTHKYAQPTAGPRPDLGSCPIARSDSARLLPHVPTLSFVVQRRRRGAHQQPTFAHHPPATRLRFTGSPFFRCSHHATRR